jgi:tRNA dimethylallyltransferase
MNREKLYELIDSRVERMLADGLVDEVRALMERGFDLSLSSMSGVGYRQIGYYLRGQIDLAEAVRLIKHHTRRFVRQQYNWFRLDDSTIRWFDVGGGTETMYPAVRRLVEEFVERSLARDETR